MSTTQQLLALTNNGNATPSILAIAVLLSLIVSLVAALLIYYNNQRQERKRNCAWCHGTDTLGGICFAHARQLQHESARRHATRRQKNKHHPDRQTTLVA